MIPDEAVEAALEAFANAPFPSEHREQMACALEAAAPYIAAAALREAADQLEYGNPVGDFLEERAVDLDPNTVKGGEE